MGLADASAARGLEEGQTLASNLAEPLIHCEASASLCAPAPTSPRKYGQEPASADKALSTLEGTFALSSCMLNYGVFSLPQAMVGAGLAVGSITVLLVSGMCMITAHQLGSVFAELRSRGESRLDYASAAEVVSGPALARFMHFWCLSELTMYVVGSLIIFYHTCQTLGIQYDASVVIGISCAIACLTASLSNRTHAVVSSFGAFAVVVACGTVLMSGWELPVKAEFTTLAGPPRAAPLVLSVASFTAATQPVLPTFFASMKSKQSFDRACRLAWTGWAVLAVVFCSLTCYFFGSSLKDVALKNVGKDLHMVPMPDGRSLTGLMAFWIVVRVQCGLTFQTRAHTEVVARACGVTVRQSRGGLQEIALAVPVFLLIGSMAVAFSEVILALENVCGGFLMGINGFLFPAFAYLRICRPTSAAAKLRAYAAICFGLVVLSAPGLSALFY